MLIATSIISLAGKPYSFSDLAWSDGYPTRSEFGGSADPRSGEIRHLPGRAPTRMGSGIEMIDTNDRFGEWATGRALTALGACLPSALELNERQLSGERGPCASDWDGREMAGDLCVG